MNVHPVPKYIGDDFSKVNSHSRDFEKYLITPVDNVIGALDQLVADFLDDVAGRQVTRGHLRNLRSHLGMFRRFVAAHPQRDFAAAVTRFAAAEYAAPGRSPRTAAAKMMSVRQFGLWLAERELLARRPRVIVRRHDGAPKARPLGDIFAALAHLDAETALLVRLLLDTGCRVGEVLRLSVTDYDPERRCITVLGKGGRQRTVGVGAEVAAELERRRGQPGAGRLFRHRSPRYFRQRIAAACAAAGVPRFNHHAIRHTYAKAWFAAGGDMPRLQAALGHSTPTMTMHYARVYNQDAVRRQQELSPVDRMAKTAITNREDGENENSIR